MSTPDSSSYDLSPSRRPTKDDFNGIAKEDEVGKEPDPREQPNAPEWNYMQWLLLSLNAVIPVTKISVQGGTPPVLVGVVSARSTFTVSSITVTRVSTGVVRLTWAAGIFPNPDVKPQAALNGTTSGMIACSNITNGVQINTFDATGAAADRDFTIQVN